MIMVNIVNNYGFDGWAIAIRHVGNHGFDRWATTGGLPLRVVYIIVPFFWICLDVLGYF